jgi:EmrB/QacA subfamily drug resistance transporter
MCSAVVFMDSSILPVALPTIQKSLQLSEIAESWVINSYLLAIACLSILGGKAADFFGHKSVFCFGMIFFGLASFAGGYADSFPSLLVARILQGIAAAAMIPSCMSILINSVDESERGRYIGWLVAIGSIFLSLGPFLGGFLTQYFCWSFVFWINIPFIIIGVLIIKATVKNISIKNQSLDFSLFLLFAIGFFSLILSLMQAKDQGWLSKSAMLLFLLAVCFSYFIFRTVRQDKFTFLNHKLFFNKRFIGGCAIVFLAQILLMMSVYWIIYFQKMYGFTPIKSGTLSLFSSLPLIIFPPFTGYFSDKLGLKGPVISGFLLTFFSFTLLALNQNFLSLPYLICCLCLFGVGIACIMTPISSAAIGSVPAEFRGLASGVYCTIRNAGAPFGIALIGSLISNISYENFQKILKNVGCSSCIDIDRCFEGLSRKAELHQLFPLLAGDLVTQIEESYLIASKFAYFISNCFCALISLFCIYLVLKVFSKKKCNYI